MLLGWEASVVSCSHHHCTVWHTSALIWWIWTFAFMKQLEQSCKVNTKAILNTHLMWRVSLFNRVTLLLKPLQLSESFSHGSRCVTKIGPLLQFFWGGGGATFILLTTVAFQQRGRGMSDKVKGVTGWFLCWGWGWGGGYRWRARNSSDVTWKWTSAEVFSCMGVEWAQWDPWQQRWPRWDGFIRPFWLLKQRGPKNQPSRSRPQCKGQNSGMMGQGWQVQQQPRVFLPHLFAWSWNLFAWSWNLFAACKKYPSQRREFSLWAIDCKHPVWRMRPCLWRSGQRQFCWFLGLIDTSVASYLDSSGCLKQTSGFTHSYSLSHSLIAISQYSSQRQQTHVLPQMTERMVYTTLTKVKKHPTGFHSQETKICRGSCPFLVSSLTVFFARVLPDIAFWVDVCSAEHFCQKLTAAAPAFKKKKKKQKIKKKERKNH